MNYTKEKVNKSEMTKQLKTLTGHVVELIGGGWLRRMRRALRLVEDPLDHQRGPLHVERVAFLQSGELLATVRP